MNVQNSERPRWAWSGQHVEVVSGWELVAPAAAAPAAAPAEPVAVDPGAVAGVELKGRPAWSWGSPVA